MASRGFVLLLLGFSCVCLVEARRWRPWKPPNECFTQIRVNCTLRGIELYPCDEQHESPTRSNSSSGGQKGQGSSPFNAMSFRGNRRPRIHRRWCSRPFSIKTVCIVTIRHCCEGWTKARNGLCTNPVQKNSTCPRGCENGGKCNEAIGQCTCKFGFAGYHCEQAVCSPSCENGGVCAVADDRPVCKCPKAFRGRRCQTPVCRKRCINGGVCTANGAQTQCICKSGYVGDRCEMLEKDGECPLPPVSRSPYPRRCTECKHDGQCRGIQKCCVSNCGLLCVDPAPTTCVLSTGKEMQIGEDYQPNPCSMCTCMEPDRNAANGGALCTTMACPPVTFRCKRQIRAKDKCCPVCAKGNTKPDNYTVPVFTDCPSGVVVVDLPQTGITVQLSPGLRAEDTNSNQLEVSYSKDRLVWHEDCERNFNLIIASARDRWDELVNCTFMVRVRDPHPPTFDACPIDITVRTDAEIVTWEPPQISDNAAKEVTLQSDFASGQTFSVGETMVTYTARDAEGNVDLCQFFVVVSAKFMEEEKETPASVEKPDADNLLGDDNDDDDAYEKYYYVGGAGALIVLLAIIGIILFAVCKRRRAVVIKEADSSATFDYPVDTALPPSYDSVVNLKDMQRSGAPPKISYENPAYATGQCNLH